MNTLQDRIRGSLIGGAIGDALGYPVEFIDSFKRIQAQYGERGITRLEVRWTEIDAASIGKAVVSDDTQMTLFTANGLLNAPILGIEPKFAICRAYLEWLETQTGQYKGKAECWIRDIPELNCRRAPGNTCITSLRDIKKGRDPINNSKGCGGVMRVAPVPLYAAVDNRMSVTDAALLAGDAAEITHQHPLGYIPAALVAHIIYRMAEDEMPTRQSLVGYIHEGMEAMKKLFPSYPYDVKYMGELADKAIALADNDKTDVTNIESIGGGWTGEEALAIALYCSVRHFDNFEGALIAAVNHAGDSDSTGAITGNILGAAIGYRDIPQFFLEDLELHDVILHMADDLYRGEVTKMEQQQIAKTMERYPKIAKLINNIDIENYPAYKECVKGIAEITAFDEYYIPFIWEEMLSAVLKSCNVKVKFHTKQAVSNWIDGAFMWNARVYAPLAREGYFPFPDCGDYYDFGFSRELRYLDSVTNPYLRCYILAIALFEILRYYVKEEMPKPRYDHWGGLIKNELSFEEGEMWEIILGTWPVQIDWNFYDLQFDGKNFVFIENNQSRLKELL